MANRGDTTGVASGWIAVAERNFRLGITAADPVGQEVLVGPVGGTTTTSIALPMTDGAITARPRPAGAFDWFANAATPRAFMASPGDRIAGESGWIAVAERTLKLANRVGNLPHRGWSIALRTTWAAILAMPTHATAFASFASAATPIASTDAPGDTIGVASGWTAAAEQTSR
jgi:hypothetical protein